MFIIFIMMAMKNYFAADLMDRNLLHRVEVAFPILDKKIFYHIYQDGLMNYLEDNVQAWELDGRGEWNQVQKTHQIHDAQAVLLEKICQLIQKKL